MKLSAAILAVGSVKSSALYEMVSCNGLDGIPEMTFRIDADFYQENNFQIDDMNPDGENSLSKTIDANDLHFMIDDDDYWSLNFHLFSDEKKSGNLVLQRPFGIDFSCKYPRNLSTSQFDFNVAGRIHEEHMTPNVGFGSFEFLTHVETADLGQRTQVFVHPKWPFPSISPRIKECEISLGDQSVFPIHSFLGEACKDPRISVEMIVPPADLGPPQDAAFAFDAFHFDTGHIQEQELTMTCTIQVIESSQYVAPDVPDCDCFTEDDCVNQFNVQSNDCTKSRWALDDDVSFPREIYYKRPDSNTWVEIDGSLQSITCSDSMGLWGINQDHVLWFRSNTREEQDQAGGTEWQQFVDGSLLSGIQSVALNEDGITVTTVDGETHEYDSFNWNLNGGFDDYRRVWYGQCTVDYNPDEGHARVLDGLNEPNGHVTTDMTIEYCISYCRDRNFVFAGLQNGDQCYCGNTAPTELAPQNECNHGCRGGQTATESPICGGAWRNSVYATGQPADRR